VASDRGCHQFGNKLITLARRHCRLKLGGYVFRQSY